MKKLQGRVTHEDVRSAGLRRWDGRARVTTDWINMFHEPELCWPTGDCLVYLREPGQSSRGPAFRVHTSFLRVKGFEALVDRCVIRNSIHPAAQCVLPNCPGCDPQKSLQELYIPAPHGAGLEDTFIHHITTRNFFAWLYNRPLVGRALGTALGLLKGRIDVYRPDHGAQNSLEVISYAESQRYLDFRECVDHALAALHLAEALRIKDLWVDAFAHCVGMSHRDLRSSIEYASISPRSKTLIDEARLEMDVRLGRINKSVTTFFEDEVSGSFLGLPQPARDHLDKFRCFLKSFYADQHGSWPPKDFDTEAVQHPVYSAMFTAFQNLYQHLVDPHSSTDLVASDMSGGVCTLQNIQAFDAQYHYDPLAQPLPMLPKANEPSAGRATKLQRRMSWNPIQKRKAEKEARKAQSKQALIDASNRDFLIMDCPLVRAFSDFEGSTVDDEVGSVSIVEGRKVRWILVYAVLQTFQAIAHPPVEVRNTANLTYALCCHVPKRMPWKAPPAATVPRSQKRRSELVPDTSYSHTNASSSSVGETLARSRSAKIRRRTLPANFSDAFKASLSSKSAPASRSTSLRRLMSRKSQPPVEDMPKPPSAENHGSGHGNSLSELEGNLMSPSRAELTAAPADGVPPAPPLQDEPHELLGAVVHELSTEDHQGTPSTKQAEDDVPPAVAPMSRESSTASMSSTWSKSSGHSYDAPTTPGSDAVCTLQEILRMPSVSKKPSTIGEEPETSSLHPAQAISQEPNTNGVTIVDVDVDHDDAMTMPAVHFNTTTWDLILAQRPLTAPAAPVVARA